LSHVNSFIQEKVLGFQVLLDCLHPRGTGRPGGLPQFSKGKVVKILASVLSGIPAMLPNGETPPLATVYSASDTDSSIAVSVEHCTLY